MLTGAFVLWMAAFAGECERDIVGSLSLLTVVVLTPFSAQSHSPAHARLLLCAMHCMMNCVIFPSAFLLLGIQSLHITFSDARAEYPFQRTVIMFVL